MTVSAEESLTVDEGRLLEWYEQMAIIRQTEKAVYDLFMSGLVKGTTHLAAGHEAVAVGASAALRPEDYVFATYRGHHHAIACTEWVGRDKEMTPELAGGFRAQVPTAVASPKPAGADDCRFCLRCGFAVCLSSKGATRGHAEVCAKAWPQAASDRQEQSRERPVR